MLRYTTARARPGLVAFYDTRPGNGGVYARDLVKTQNCDKIV